MTLLLLALAVLLLQIVLGLPGAPSWCAAVFLPMVFIVGGPLRSAERRWPHSAIGLGLAWDVLFEPVIGPGAIAWSAAAVVLGAVVPLVADRSPKAWTAFGALGATLVIVVRYLALLPLGLAAALSWSSALTTILLTAFWCGLVGWVIALDLPVRWRGYRARKLR